jgi:hypothetical protein
MGASGGGASGKIGYPTYMEGVHYQWLTLTGTDVIELSMAGAMNNALGNSPFTALVAYDPDADISAYTTIMTDFKSLIGLISETVDWAALLSQADTSLIGLADARVIDSVNDYADIIDDNITVKVLPRFRRGMQDINAVMSSAFVIGEAVIESFRDRDVAKYTTDIALKFESDKLQAVEQMMKIMLQRYAWEEAYMKTAIEAYRIKIVAKKEEVDQNATLEEADARWDLEVFQYGSNLMAAPGGAAVMTHNKGVNKTASTIGGGVSGAAAGAMVGASYGGYGGYYGAAIGAVLGGVAGYLGASS